MILQNIFQFIITNVLIIICIYNNNKETSKQINSTKNRMSIPNGLVSVFRLIIDPQLSMLFFMLSCIFDIFCKCVLISLSYDDITYLNTNNKAIKRKLRKNFNVCHIRNDSSHLYFADKCK